MTLNEKLDVLSALQIVIESLNDVSITYQWHCSIWDKILTREEIAQNRVLFEDVLKTFSNIVHDNM